MSIDAINFTNNVSFTRRVKPAIIPQTPKKPSSQEEVLTQTMEGLANAGKSSINLTSITFNKGLATFNGTICDTLGNGDDVEYTFRNGLLAQSAISGSRNITKKFEYTNGGVKPTSIETIDENGETINKADFTYHKDGTVAAFHDNKRTAYLNYGPNGEYKRVGFHWIHENIQEIDEDGTIRYVESPEYVKSFNYGYPVEECRSDGTYRNWDTLTHILTFEKLPDGTKRCWDGHNGKLKWKELPDGTSTWGERNNTGDFYSSRYYSDECWKGE